MPCCTAIDKKCAPKVLLWTFCAMVATLTELWHSSSSCLNLYLKGVFLIPKVSLGGKLGHAPPGSLRKFRCTWSSPKSFYCLTDTFCAVHPGRRSALFQARKALYRGGFKWRIKQSYTCVAPATKVPHFSIITPFSHYHNNRVCMGRLHADVPIF